MVSAPSNLDISNPPTPPLNSNSVQETIHTNTLLITGLPDVFFLPTVLDALKSNFEAFGELYAWVPLPSVRRVLFVYHNEDHAECAKRTADRWRFSAKPTLPEIVLRVYRAEPTPIIQASSGEKISPFHLRPPAIEKNFLISPPGSPPVGWEQAREEPPNDAPLAEDLIIALRRLQLSQEQDANPGLSVLVKPEEGSGVGVYVEDCSDEELATESDSDQGEGWYYSQPSNARRTAPAPTKRPPMSSTA